MNIYAFTFIKIYYFKMSFPYEKNAHLSAEIKSLY